MSTCRIQPPDRDTRDVSQGGTRGFTAFSTAGAGQINEESTSSVAMYPNYELSLLFQATVEATEAAIVNAMVAAVTSLVVLHGVVIPEPQVVKTQGRSGDVGVV